MGKPSQFAESVVLIAFCRSEIHDMCENCGNEVRYRRQCAVSVTVETLNTIKSMTIATERVAAAWDCRKATYCSAECAKEGEPGFPQVSRLLLKSQDMVDVEFRGK